MGPVFSQECRRAQERAIKLSSKWVGKLLGGVNTWRVTYATIANILARTKGSETQHSQVQMYQYCKRYWSSSISLTNKNSGVRSTSGQEKQNFPVTFDSLTDPEARKEHPISFLKCLQERYGNPEGNPKVHLVSTRGILRDWPRENACGALFWERRSVSQKVH